jgi:hypothetical protein
MKLFVFAFALSAVVLGSTAPSSDSDVSEERIVQNLGMELQEQFRQAADEKLQFMSDLKAGIDADQVREAFVVDLPASVAQSFEPQVREIIRTVNGDPQLINAHKGMIQEKWVQHYTEQSGNWDKEHPELSALVQSRSQGRLQKRMGVGAQIAIAFFAMFAILFVTSLTIMIASDAIQAKRLKKIAPTGDVLFDEPGRTVNPPVAVEAAPETLQPASKAGKVAPGAESPWFQRLLAKLSVH